METKKRKKSLFKSMFESLSPDGALWAIVILLVLFGLALTVALEYYDYKFADKDYEVVREQEILSITLQKGKEDTDLIVETSEQTYAVDLVEGHLSAGSADKNYFYEWYEPNKEKEVITIQLTNESFKKLSAEYAELYGKTLKKYEYSKEDYKEIFNTSNDMFNPSSF